MTQHKKYNIYTLLQVPSQGEETELLLGIPPDRIGHGTFLCNSPRVVEMVKQKNIPIGTNFICKQIGLLHGLFQAKLWKNIKLTLAVGVPPEPQWLIANLV